jgi:hypothetical protein
MLKQALVCVSLAAMLSAGPALAETTNVTLSPAASAADSSGTPQLPTRELLTDIVTWLSANYGLPQAAEHPRIEFVTPARMAAVRFRGLASDRAAVEAGRSAPPEFGLDVYALYDSAARVIYLHRNWNAARPADVSVLVHELVHHLQTTAGQQFACAQEREKDAYNAQRGWLDRFGTTIEQEFEIDAMSILVRTNCGF